MEEETNEFDDVLIELGKVLDALDKIYDLLETKLSEGLALRQPEV